MKPASDVSLPFRSDSNARQDEIDAALDQTLGPTDSPELWAMRPMVFELAEPTRATRPSSILDCTVSSGVEIARGMGTQCFRGVLFALDTGNQRRVLEPLIVRAGGTVRRHIGRAAIVHTSRHRVAELVDRLEHSFRSASLEFDRKRAARRVRDAAASIEISRRLVDELHPRIVAVANQHNANTRALLLAARESGVNTFYVPHAPVARTRRYRDLPVSVAGLRGPAERAWYMHAGAKPEGLEVVGDPGWCETGPQQLVPDGFLVLALPNLDLVAVESIVRLVATVTGNARVLVTAHPQARKRPGPSLPPGWDRVDVDTRDVLQRGPYCLLQSSSGVAWESLALGIPTVQLSFPGVEPSYPLIAEPFVSFASSTHDLKQEIDRCVELARDAYHRARLVAWAREWCEPVNGPAASKAWEVLDALRTSASLDRVVLDGWAQPAGGRL
jgi:hypothetical protein